MHWIIQENVFFREKTYDNLLETCQRFDLPHSIHKVVPFVGELLPEPVLTSKNAICMGSYAMRHWAKKSGVTPGVFDLEEFDFNVQLEHWSKHMLNYDSVVSRFIDVEFTEQEMFLRPIADSKAFTGVLMDEYTFNRWRDDLCKLKLNSWHNLNEDTLVQISSKKIIYSECRFWIVKGKIVTSSMYKIGDIVHYTNLLPDDKINTYVYNRIAEWSPLEAFVIDIADTNDGFKVIEINTLNSCGFYAADIQKLVMTLEEGFTE